MVSGSQECVFVRRASATGNWPETQKNGEKTLKNEKLTNVTTNVANALATFVVRFLVATFAVNYVPLSEPGTSSS